MQKKKVYVITLQNVRNYGSALQAVAMQKVFEDMSCEVKFFDYYKSLKDLGFMRRAKGYAEGEGLVSRIVKSIILIPTFVKQDKVFDSFLKRNLKVIPGRVATEDDFKRLTLDADIYCTGSDQTWNSGWNNGILRPLFLTFAPEGKERIAYAASFGKSQLDEWEIAETKKLLSKYKAISVREASAEKIVHDLHIGIEAVHVLDPTLQVDGNFWRKLTHPVKHDKYCLLYQLNRNPYFDRFAVEMAHRRGLKLLRWCNRYDQLRLSGDIKVAVPDVEDFVSLIDHADLVLTDSFHCTAFCCNLNKQFLSVYPEEYSSRLDSLLKLTNLEHRHVDRFDAESYDDMPAIDFKSVNVILNQERVKGRDFLTKALED